MNAFTYLTQRIAFLKGLVIVVGLLSMTSQLAEAAKPFRTSIPPTGIGGKWMYGTFSPSSFWDATGKYNGSAYEQSMAFNFGPNGTYEMYVINATTYYSCRTAAYTYFKGKATVNETERTISLAPSEGTQRGTYSCMSGKDFKRPASVSELTKAKKFYRYTLETDEKGQSVLRIYVNDTDQQGMRFKPAHW